MKRLIPVFLMSFFFFACSESTPKNVLPKKEMINLLTEIHLVDGYAMTLRHDSAAKATAPFYQAVFNKYKTDTAALENSLKYYSTKPDVIKEIYASVNKKLEGLYKVEQKKQDDKRKKIEKARLDSLKKDSLKKDSAKRKNDLLKTFKEKKIMKKDSVKRAGDRSTK